MMMTQISAIDWTDAGELEVLTFDLQGETFAIEAVLVREILDVMPETVMPGASPLVGSVMNFRGKIIPLADLRLAFDMAAADATIDSRIVVIELELDDEPALIGIRTDKVNEVTTFLARSSEDPPVVGMRWRREFVRGLVRREGGVAVLPDLHAIFDLHRRGGDSAAAPTQTVH